MENERPLQHEKELNVCIRKAVAEDYEAAEKLMQQVQALHVAWRPDIYRPNDVLFSKAYFAELMSKEACYVAETDGKAVGLLNLSVRQIESPAHCSRTILLIEAMAVDEAFRGRGIGHRFFDTVRALKEAQHFDGIELQVNAKNQAAYTMYRNYGFTEKSINMELLE